MTFDHDKSDNNRNLYKIIPIITVKDIRNKTCVKQSALVRLFQVKQCLMYLIFSESIKAVGMRSPEVLLVVEVPG